MTVRNQAIVWGAFVVVFVMMLVFLREVLFPFVAGFAKSLDDFLLIFSIYFDDRIGFGELDDTDADRAVG